MNFHRTHGKWIANLLLLLILAAALGLLLLNVISPTLPTIRCKGNATHDPDISHKYRGDTVTTLVILSVSLLLPLFELLIAEWFINKEPQNVYEYPPAGTTRYRRTLLMAFRWYRDYFFGIGVMLLLNDIAKTTFGSPRPHWIDSCSPKFREEDCQLGWVYNYTCTNNKFSQWRLADSRKSFPSGHSALSVYAAIFMIFYQTCRLRAKRWGSVVILFLHAMWGSWAIYCALSRITDYQHHPVDVIGGGILGAVISLFSAMVLCGNFRKTYLNLESYQNKVMSGLNGNATILEGFSTSPCHPNDSKGMSYSAGEMPSNGNGPPRLNGDMKRPSLRRLLSTQSNITTMSEIAEDRELDNL